MAARSTFSLRLNDPAVRDGVREVAALEHLSQNEYIEQAIRNDLLVRGELRAQHLAAAASRLQQLSDDAYRSIVERSLTAFSAGEAGPDPLQMRALHGDAHDQRVPPVPSRRVVGILDAVAAFRTS